MNEKTTQLVKQSIVKVVGIGSNYNTVQPYLIETDYESGGTAFFINQQTLNSNFPGKKMRYLLTNFHVVQNYSSRMCKVEWPERAGSFMKAYVKFVVPNIDVAVLEINPFGDHPQWYAQDHAEFLENIPNLQLDDKTMIRGQSQRVRAIGFPNLCDDRQLSDGTLCGRGCGMLQLDITLNGGNSGGPLFLKNKVIGINTASVAESERISLAVPIKMICDFFKRWTNFESIILRTPAYGFQFKVLTKDYLQFKGVESSFEGALIKNILKGTAADKAGLKERDILLGITSDVNRFNVNSFGKVMVPYCDAMVSLDDVEFLLHLDTEVELSILRGKKQLNLKIKPEPIDFKVCHRFPNYEDIEYVCFGGMVFMDLNMNHLKDEEDDEDESSSEDISSLLHTLKGGIGMKTMVICTHITPQSHVSIDASFTEYSQVVKINKVKVKDVSHLKSLLKDIALAFHSRRTKFLEIETESDTHIYSLERLQTQEFNDALRPGFPIEKLLLVSPSEVLPKRKRRKRTI